jgi:hypothetical protein
MTLEGSPRLRLHRHAQGYRRARHAGPRVSFGRIPYRATTSYSGAGGPTSSRFVYWDGTGLCLFHQAARARRVPMSNGQPANKQPSIAGQDWGRDRDPARSSRAVKEYLATLDDTAWRAASEVIPKFVSPSDPAT